MNLHLLLASESPKLFGIQLLNMEGFAELIIRFGFNFTMVFVLARMLYYKLTKRKDYLLTYFLLGTVIFLLCFLLSNVKLQLGFALGLFAIFGIIRYRTDAIPIKEMTYLFIIIGVSVINALANKKISYAELVFTNLVILAVTYSLEKIWLLRHESRKVIDYEKIELIKPENRALLLQDLEARTGLKIERIDIGRIDFMRDSARILIYYFEDLNHPNLADDESYVRRKDDDD